MNEEKTMAMINAEEIARRAVQVYELRSRISAASCVIGEDEGPPCIFLVRDEELDESEACDGCRLKMKLKPQARKAQAALTRAARSWRRQAVPGGMPPEPWEQDR
jgi:hypothetical protein